MPMITRKEYMANSANLHRAYYSQFITEEMEQLIQLHIGLDRLLTSKDEHFNDITDIREWDAMMYSTYDKRDGRKLCAGWLGNIEAYETRWHFNCHPVIKLMRDAGDVPTLSGYTCTFKECARQMVERAKGVQDDCRRTHTHTDDL